MIISRLISGCIKEYIRMCRIQKKWGGYNRIYTTKIHPSVVLGKHIYLPETVDIRSNVVIGDYSYCSKGAIIFSGTKIGKYCSIGYNVQIGLPEHPLNHISTSPSVYRSEYLYDAHKAKWPSNDIISPPVVDNDVWIGSNACILQGVHIGNGAIVAAGAIVTKDVEPYSVVGGSPAHVIKYRFEEPIRSRLDESHWWDHDHQWINDNYDNLMKGI